MITKNQQIMRKSYRFCQDDYYSYLIAFIYKYGREMRCIRPAGQYSSEGYRHFVRYANFETKIEADFLFFSGSHNTNLNVKYSINGIPGQFDIGDNCDNLAKPVKDKIAILVQDMIAYFPDVIKIVQKNNRKEMVDNSYALTSWEELFKDYYYYLSYGSTGLKVRINTKDKNKPVILLINYNLFFNKIHDTDFKTRAGIIILEKRLKEIKLKAEKSNKAPEYLKELRKYKLIK